MTEPPKELIHNVRMYFLNRKVRRIEARLAQEREEVGLEKALALTERKHLLAETERLEAEAEQAEVDGEFYRILIFNNDGPEVQ